ncbi:MAG TPA: c-type cytochrome domain-containing protein [Isosphaeraceae bacterium]|jgi:Tol biopolymer transport system component|nr:c-type cytochrome domain-containing protein [Isosphaeraceae bacterium]
MILALVVLASTRATAADDTPVSYEREVVPLIEDECIACHDDGFETSDLSLASVEAMRKGGRRGPAIVPGKGKESLLVQFMTGARQPQMPPKVQLPLDKVAVITRWIDQGAKVDGPGLGGDGATSRKGKEKADAREEGATSSLPPPVTALAFAPDGKALAVASSKEVLIVDPSVGALRHRLGGFPDQVTAVAFRPDGKQLAGAGGQAGRRGEVHLWDAATWAEANVLRGHDDTVLALAWRPGSNQFATSSLDKLILIRDADSGKVVRTIKNHADIVAALAYSADGKRLASGSADKTAKVFDAETGLQEAGLSSHNDAVLQVAFSPDGQYLATAGNDRNIHLWKLGQYNNPERGFGHTGPVYALAWMPDSKALFAGAGGRPPVLSYRREDGRRLIDLKADTMPADWVYTLAIAPDGRTLAAGGWDGSVTLWDLKDGSRLRAFVPGREAESIVGKGPRTHGK